MTPELSAQEIRGLLRRLGVSGTAWDKNRPLLLELAGFPLARRPNNASFLAILMGACADNG